MSSTLAQITIERLSVEKQIEANKALLESACYGGNAADVRHLCKHAHQLLERQLVLTQRYCAEVKRSFR